MVAFLASDDASWVNGQSAVVVDIQRQPGANIIETADRVKALLPKLGSSLPPSATRPSRNCGSGTEGAGLDSCGAVFAGLGGSGRCGRLCAVSECIEAYLSLDDEQQIEYEQLIRTPPTRR